MTDMITKKYMIEQNIEDNYEKLTELEYKAMFPDAQPTPGGDSLSISGYLPKGYGDATVNVTTP